MSLDDPARAGAFPAALRHPQISLLGSVDKDMVEKLCGALKAAKPGEDLAIELTTPGGDPELARRMVLEIEMTRRTSGRRVLFLGKTQVYSSGVTFMAAFPRADRYLTRDAVLLIHARQLDERVEISGPIRASMPQVEGLCREFEMAMKLEEKNFRKLIEGSRVELDALLEKALYNWYVTAEEAEALGLIAGIVD